MQIEAIHSATWLDAAGTAFDADVTIAGRRLTYTVRQDDPSPVAVELWRRVIEEGEADIAPPAGPTAAYLTAYLADRRWQAETGGTAWNGWVLPTDDRSQGKYMAEVQAISLGVRVDGSPWKFGHGFEPLTNDQVREMAIAARDHVLACFALEAQLAADIADGTITTTDQIDSAFAALEPKGA